MSSHRVTPVLVICLSYKYKIWKCHALYGFGMWVAQVNLTFLPSIPALLSNIHLWRTFLLSLYSLKKFSPSQGTGRTLLNLTPGVTSTRLDIHVIPLSHSLFSSPTFVYLVNKRKWKIKNLSCGFSPCKLQLLITLAFDGFYTSVSLLKNFSQ